MIHRASFGKLVGYTCHTGWSNHWKRPWLLWLRTGQFWKKRTVGFQGIALFTGDGLWLYVLYRSLWTIAMKVAIDFTFCCRCRWWCCFINSCLLLVASSWFLWVRVLPVACYLLFFVFCRQKNRSSSQVAIWRVVSISVFFSPFPGISILLTPI